MNDALSPVIWLQIVDYSYLAFNMMDFITICVSVSLGKKKLTKSNILNRDVSEIWMIIMYIYYICMIIYIFIYASIPTSNDVSLLHIKCLMHVYKPNERGRSLLP